MEASCKRAARHSLTHWSANDIETGGGGSPVNTWTGLIEHQLVSPAPAPVPNPKHHSDLSQARGYECSFHAA